MSVSKIPFIVFTLLLIWFIFIFHNSDQGYQQQSLIPWLQGNLDEQTIRETLPEMQIQYGKRSVSSQEDPYRFIEFFIRKSAHLIQYAILAMIMAFFIRNFSKRTIWITALPIITVIITASIDEYNQSLHPDRTGTILDVYLDITGGVIGLIVFLTVEQGLRYWKKKKSSLDEL